MDILLKAIDYLNTNNEYHVKADKKHGREEKHGEDADRVEKRRRLELHNNRYRCHVDGCGRSFRSNQSLKQHIMLESTGHGAILDQHWDKPFTHPARWDKNGNKFVPDKFDPYYSKCKLCNHGFLEGWINRSKLERHYKKVHPGIDCPPPMQQNHNTLIRFV